MPTTVISVSRQGQAHPAVALGLDHRQRCRSRRSRSSHPRCATLTRQELRAQVAARRLGQRRRVVAQRPASAPGRSVAAKMSRISARL